ncbi:BZ3501_MvSof-1269-A2-R1_C40g00185 [Microbotryum saponariae]|nr:BZ3501_MvSof-1269-A2-R1_C40g00185 [Microbotryum saponariae]
MSTPTVTSADDAGWRFAQCFGDKGEVEDITEADIIYQEGVRVQVLHRVPVARTEFDYLKSLEIEEKINKIRWCKRQNAAHFLLSTNGNERGRCLCNWQTRRAGGRRTPPPDKTIKLWKVFEKSLKVLHLVAATTASTDRDPGLTPSSPTRATTTSNGTPYLRLPRMTYHDTIVAAVPRKVNANAHAYHINSISINSDGETYMSADDLRVNLWNLNISDQSFTDPWSSPRPEFHPISCNLFCYSSSKGTVKLADMREQALLYEEEEDPSNKSFFSEIISSVSDVKFSKDGRYILSRDYLTLRIWDINMESRPVQTINVHDHLRSKLCDLYENDCIFDKFECTFSGDGQHSFPALTNNHFHIYDKEATTDIVLQADKSAFKAKKIGGNKAKQGAGAKGAQGANKKPIIDVDSIDFNKKILHASWHPRESTIAIAATNNLFLYSQTSSSSGAGGPP